MVQDAADWHRQLTDPAPGKRRTAVKRLAEVGDEPAWEAILGALEDPEPEVADQAQLALGEISDEDGLELLLGRRGLRSRDDWVRLRVAEALGRARFAIDGEQLAEFARQADGEVARMLCWSFERLAAVGRLGGDATRAARAMAKTGRMQRDPDVRAAAWRALAAIDPAEALGAVDEAWRDKAAALRVAALQVDRAAREQLGELDGSEALANALRLANDPARSVRAQAAVNLTSIGSHAAAAALVERLEAEPEARLRTRLLAALRALSGMRYGADPRQWRHWLAGLDPTWSAPPSARDAARAEEAGGPPGVAAEAAGRTASFAGLPVLSGRVAFVIDLSGSIWREQEDGRTRKQMVDELLRAALETLPPETRFNVIPYSNDPLPWRDELVVASERNVAEALDYFESCQARGRGNYFDAALCALKDPEVDTILALTDGVPTGGRRWNLELMVTLLVEKTRFRHVAFDAVLVDTHGGIERHWQRLAAETGGQVLSIRL